MPSDSMLAAKALPCEERDKAGITALITCGIKDGERKAKRFRQLRKFR